MTSGRDTSVDTNAVRIGPTIRRVRMLAAAVSVSFVALACGQVAPRPPSSTAPVCETAQRRLLGSTSVIARVDRLEVKRMTAREFMDGSQGQLPVDVRDPEIAVCVVAIAGDIRQPGGVVQRPPRNWSVHVSVETPDEPLAGQYSSDGAWPAYFPGLPSR